VSTLKESRSLMGEGVGRVQSVRDALSLIQAIDTQSGDIAVIELLTADFQKTSEILGRKTTHFRLNG